MRALEHAKSDLKFDIQDLLLGGVRHSPHAYLLFNEDASDFGKLQCSIDATGTPLSDEALDIAIGANAILLGAVGGPVRLPNIEQVPLKLSVVDDWLRNGLLAPCDLNKAF